MKTAITVELDGTSFALDERALLALRAYLDRAAARLRAHPDRVEVLAALERNVAAKLARRGAAPNAPIAEAEMLAALKEVGRVDGPDLGEADPATAGSYGRSRTRRLYRLKEGQQIVGVCTGLAAFADVEVGIVRLIFILGAVFSGGLLLVAYVVLMFVMPIAHTEVEIAAAHGR